MVARAVRKKVWVASGELRTVRRLKSRWLCREPKLDPVTIRGAIHTENRPLASFWRCVVAGSVAIFVAIPPGQMGVDDGFGGIGL